MAGNSPGWIYVLHLTTPLHNPHSVKRHYLGWTEDPTRRIIEEHANGRTDASRFMAECKRQGIRFVIGALFRGTPADESKLKRQRNHKRLCSVCR